jgi:tRNA pseudouridine55 synthase
VLPIALGEATKTVPFVMDGRKEYRFTLCFGQARSTEDAEGEVTATSDLRPTDEAIRSALATFIGDIEQVPPAFSALKIEGKRAYDLARASQPVDLKPRRVLIDRLALLGRPDTDHADFVVSCGKGTYIRSLGRDLARALGTVGHLSALRRTAAGPFREEAAISLPKLEALGHIPALLGALAPVATALDDIPALALTEAQADRLRQGQPVLLTRDAPPSGALLRAETGSRLVALVRSDGASLKPVRVFNL